MRKTIVHLALTLHWTLRCHFTHARVTTRPIRHNFIPALLRKQLRIPESVLLPVEREQASVRSQLTPRCVLITTKH